MSLKETATASRLATAWASAIVPLFNTDGKVATPAVTTVQMAVQFGLIQLAKPTTEREVRLSVFVEVEADTTDGTRTWHMKSSLALQKLSTVQRRPLLTNRGFHSHADDRMHSTEFVEQQQKA